MTRPADLVDDAWTWFAGSDVGTDKERGCGRDEKSGRWESCEHVCFFSSVKEWTVWHEEYLRKALVRRVGTGHTMVKF